MRRAVKFVPQKGDLLEVTYPKSGTHWVQYVMQLILREGGSIENYEEFIGASVFIEYYDVRWERCLPSSPFRTFITHIPISRDKFNPDAKYIYVARNPWDVCVSFYYHVKTLSYYDFQDGSFDDFLDVFLQGDFGYGDYFDHVASAYSLRNEPNVLFLTYEELKRDMESTVIRMAKFLGERHSSMLDQDCEDGRNRLQLILERAKAENMRKAMEIDLVNSERAELKTRMRELNATSNASLVRETTHFNLVREGNVGGWKKHFNHDQLQRMEAAIAERTRGSDFMDLWADIRLEAFHLANQLCR
ncbi:sulfotransferase 2A1-like [Amblyomma americanum]